jgi:hypothetical protein
MLRARVAIGLAGEPIPGMYQDQRDLGVGGAGRHVTGALFVPWRIHDEEGTAWRGKIPIGDVDGDALLALGLKPVEEQRII